MAAAPELADDIAREATRWFAFYFQIRRAWANTYAFIHGGSDVMRALRGYLCR